MMKLDNFINMMTGHFNNKEQFDNMQREGKTYPYAEHINTICNEKIMNLPKDFNGKFVVEENFRRSEITDKKSRSLTNDARKGSVRLLLFYGLLSVDCYTNKLPFMGALIAGNGI